MSDRGKATADRRSGGSTRPAAERVQTKMKVGDTTDPMEREADAVAQQVVAGQPASIVSRMAAAPEKKKDEPVRRAAAPEKKKDEPVRRAAAPEKKKDEPVRRAAAPEKKKDEPVRRAAAPEKKKDEPVRRAAAPEKKKDEPVRRAAAPEKKKDEPVRRQAVEEEVQAKSAGGSSSDAMSSAAQHAVDSKGPGRSLDSSVRSQIESSTGADMGHVRVHDDAPARASADALNARAFTHGSDIWMGPGESSSNVQLMAHEAAHVMQQGGAAQRLVQRNGTTGGGTTTTPDPAAAAAAVPPDPATLPLEFGRPDPATNTITFAQLQIPPFKMAAHRGPLYTAKPLKRKRNYERGNPGQRDKWRNDLDKSHIQEVLEERVKQATHVETVDPAATHVFEVPVSERGGRPFLFGPLPTLARDLTTPMWGGTSRTPDRVNFFDVDHIVELQVANWNDDTSANELPNMELLDSEINQESGRVIRDNIEAKVQSFLDRTGTRFGTSVADVKERYTLIFTTPVSGGGGARTASRANYWTRTEIETGEHLRPVRVSDPSALGGHGIVRVFSTESGGLGKSFRWPSDELSATEADWLRPFVITRKNFVTEGEVESTATLGALWINTRPGDPNWKRFPNDKRIPVNRVPGARYAGWIAKASVLDQMYDLRHERMSPVRIDQFDLLPEGLFVQGVVLPELPLMRDANINFELSNGRLMLYKEFTAGAISVPPPFEITSTSLRIFADTERGLGADGRVNFGIQRVGEGYIAATISTSGPIGFSGAFDFDSRTFDPARIELSYLDGVFRGHGVIGIPDGKVAGVKRAQLDINVEGTAVSGTGVLEPKVRAIREGTVTFSHSEATGTSITGALQLSDDIPNVQSGSIEATLSKPAGQEEWDLAAHGTVTAGVPGFTATVNADYHNGLFTVEGSGAFQRGMLSGTVSVGATNRALGADGTPTDTIGDQVIAYGGGTVTVRLTPWLQGTVGVRFLPNGELELTGTIALPATLDIFPEKRLDRNIFSINLDIPIIGFAVAGQRVGIFATIGGGLDLTAGIGPGQLQELGISITYNPAHEDQTHIQGGAKLVIPAHAGLRLFIRGAIGAGIPIVSASLGLEVGGQLGLEGAVEASVDVDWTPSTGLVLDALGEIYVQPKFRFDLTGFLTVDADLFLFEVNLYEKRWELAAFELGPDLRFGVRFPIHYQEGQPFDISMDDLQFEVPDVDTDALLGEIIDKII